MILHVKKHPDPATLSTVRYVEDGTPVPDGWELMRREEHEEWTQKQIDGGWVATHPTPVPASAQMWQVKVWMVRNGINLASIPQIIAAQIPEGAQRDEALVRWEHTTEVPFDNALVGLVAAGLKIEKQTAWEEILAI